jgi:hypothetical protein
LAREQQLGGANAQVLLELVWVEGADRPVDPRPTLLSEYGEEGVQDLVAVVKRRRSGEPLPRSWMRSHSPSQKMQPASAWSTSEMAA